MQVEKEHIKYNITDEIRITDCSFCTYQCEIEDKCILDQLKN